MKKLFLFLCLSQGYMITQPLSSPPSTITSVKELALIYNDQLPDLWNNLSPEERVFTYYMYRASLPGSRIFRDQNHRHSLKIIELFEHLIKNKEKIQLEDADTFIKDIETYFIYLTANHGTYFSGEHAQSKRTPHKLGLHALTHDNLKQALNSIDYVQAESVVNALHESIFDEHFEPTVTIEGSIEESAGNMYSVDFTEKDFQTLAPEEKIGINHYFTIEYQDGKRVATVQKYKIGEKYSEELSVAKHWLEKAYEHAQQYPQTFDSHIVSALQHMITFLETGNEEDFKKHSIEWTQTNSHIDFNFGFIEVYQDPKQYRGTFQADVTVKTVNMEKLNALLPSLEAQLPFPDEFKRPHLADGSGIPNASINAKIFAAGDLGPVQVTCAYCLPNYAELRAEYGSKQIIYQYGKGLGALTNPDTFKKLHLSREHLAWSNEHDPDGQLDRDVWNMHTILHETLGHGSGKLAEHTFKEGENLTIGGTTYNVGDSIPVTADNINEFLGSYFSGHEELRAEILALYTCIANFDELAQIGLFKEWPQKIEKDKLIELFIIHMAKQGISRLVNQPEDAKELVQAHTIADSTIMYYMLDHGSLEVVEESVELDGKTYTVLDLKINDLNEAIETVKELAIEVQRIKSTGDGVALNKMMKKYGTCVRYPHFIKILKQNRQAVQGDLKRITDMFPHFDPEIKNNKIVDISASWPTDFIEQQLLLNELELSKE